MVPSPRRMGLGCAKHWDEPCTAKGLILFRCTDAPWFERVVKFGGMKCTIAPTNPRRVAIRA
jgi:LDH2 family malate/lactate/ureidoglycolate dehydrogenase